MDEGHLGKAICPPYSQVVIACSSPYKLLTYLRFIKCSILEFAVFFESLLEANVNVSYSKKVSWP